MIDRARIARVAGLALAALGLSACLGTPGVEQRVRQANDLASTHGFRLHTLVTDGLGSYKKKDAKGDRKRRGDKKKDRKRKKDD